MAVEQLTNTELLERTDQLEALHDALGTARIGSGVLVLLAGEAGGGKTVLVRRFCSDGRCGRVLWGACDPLFTPRPLGPFVDLAQDLGGEVQELVESGARPYQISAAISRQAQRAPGLVIVIEDLHWADEASLDVVSLLGRRISSIPALVVATYRDDQLGPAHPLRMVLGELRSVRRLSVAPLTIGAVRDLAGPSGVDAAELHRITAGNPFFVTEVLAAGMGTIPTTVRDAVLARAARLGAAATAVTEAVSIALPHAEPWLLDVLVPDAGSALDAGVSSGILEFVPGGVAFRHELARLAILDTVPPHRLRDLHRRALSALCASSAGAVDLARLAHHAEAAGDAEAVHRFAPAAARHAASIGAHREAAAQYQRALRFEAPASQRAELLEGLSYACYLTDQTDESIAALRQAIILRREAGDGLSEGADLSSLSRRLWCGGHLAQAAEAALDAARLLEALAVDGRELAFAYSNLAQLALNDERLDDTMTWSGRALDLANPLGDTDVIVHSLNNVGTAKLLAGCPSGRDDLERSLALAERAGLEEHVGRAYIHAAWVASRTRGYDLPPWFDRGIEVCEDLGLEGWRLYVQVYRARYHLDQGRWPRAVEDAELVLRSARSVPLLRLMALTVLALVRARRGEPDVWPALDEAFVLARGRDELQFLAPVAAARAEVLWLEGRHPEVDGETRDGLDLAVRRSAGWVVGELAWLRRLAGIRESTHGAGGPYAAQLAGADAEASCRWTALGCPYDAALAGVASEHEDRLRHSLAEFQRLGALPAARIVARRLRQHGFRGVPRGPRPTTRQHPARLTRREGQVLALVRSGCSNAEIAVRLFLSERTVHHHVAAILRKLGVDSRTQAVSAAQRLGLGDPPM